MDRRDFLKYSASAAAGVLLTPLAQAGELFTKNEDKMKIVVLTGSPRRNGNTNYLADRFIAGAQEKGHTVFRFDCAAHKVAGCMACNRCGMDGDCVLKDDFDQVRPRLIEADMVVFVTPMYYFGFSAQLKNVIDRFYAINGRIKGAPKKTAFLMAYANTSKKGCGSHAAALPDIGRLSWLGGHGHRRGSRSVDGRFHTEYTVR